MVNLIFWLVLAALSFSPKTEDRRATCQDKLAGGQIYTGFTPSKEVNVTGVNSIYYITGCSKSLGRSCPQSPERERERCDYLKPRFVFLEGPAHPHGVFLESWLVWRRKPYEWQYCTMLAHKVSNLVSRATLQSDTCGRGRTQDSAPA